MKHYLTKFMLRAVLAKQTTECFSHFLKQGVLKIQRIRTQLLLRRAFTENLLIKRLKDQADILIDFYSKKKATKKSTKII